MPRWKLKCTFIPQAWVNGYAVEVDPTGRRSWETVFEGEKLPRERDYGSDDLRHCDAAPQWVREWPGPFEVDFEVLESLEAEVKPEEEDPFVRMTQDEVCSALVKVGGKEYRDPFSHELGVRAFEFEELNGRSGDDQKRPRLHARCFPDLRPNGAEVHAGGVEFDLWAVEGGRSLHASLYSVRRHEAVDVLPKARKALQAVWTAFSAAMLDYR